ncbi:HK97 gp10 family phage protein [Thomasclavelia ramosa]|uniref:HK97 gp10 family phage protein n=1 Tax=Thomasclavelia ramosa TaxID=1547 RepID=UPI0036F3D138
MSDIIVEGLDEFEKALTKEIEINYPREFEKMVIQIAIDLQTAVQDATPVRTSHLQENWFVGDLVKRGNTYYIEVYNNVEYAEPVEYGHRTKNGGFVEGAHMMEISIELLKIKLPQHLRNWLSNMLNKLEL